MPQDSRRRAGITTLLNCQKSMATRFFAQTPARRPMQDETLMPGKRGRQPGQKIDSRALSGTIGTSHLQRMIGSLVRAMGQPELSAQMRLKLCRQITELRADIARCKIEAARRKADALLAEPPTVSPNSSPVP